MNKIETQTLKVKKFKSRVTKSTAYGLVEDYGEVENTMTLLRSEDNLLIAWEVGDDVDYCEMGVTTVGKAVTDIDGVFEAPKEALELLESYGLDTKEL